MEKASPFSKGGVFEVYERRHLSPLQSFDEGNDPEEPCLPEVESDHGNTRRHFSSVHSSEESQENDPEGLCLPEVEPDRSVRSDEGYATHRRRCYRLGHRLATNQLDKGDNHFIHSSHSDSSSGSNTVFKDTNRYGEPAKSDSSSSLRISSDDEEVGQPRPLSDFPTRVYTPSPSPGGTPTGAELKAGTHFSYSLPPLSSNVGEHLLLSYGPHGTMTRQSNDTKFDPSEPLANESSVFLTSPADVHGHRLDERSLFPQLLTNVRGDRSDGKSHILRLPHTTYGDISNHKSHIQKSPNDFDGVSSNDKSHILRSFDEIDDEGSNERSVLLSSPDDGDGNISNEKRPLISSLNNVYKHTPNKISPFPRATDDVYADKSNEKSPILRSPSNIDGNRPNQRSPFRPANDIDEDRSGIKSSSSPDICENFFSKTPLSMASFSRALVHKPGQSSPGGADTPSKGSPRSLRSNRSLTRRINQRPLVYQNGQVSSSLPLSLNLGSRPGFYIPKRALNDIDKESIQIRQKKQPFPRSKDEYTELRPAIEQYKRQQDEENQGRQPRHHLDLFMGEQKQNKYANEAMPVTNIGTHLTQSSPNNSLGRSKLRGENGPMFRGEAGGVDDTIYSTKTGDGDYTMSKDKERYNGDSMYKDKTGNIGNSLFRDKADNGDGGALYKDKEGDENISMYKDKERDIDDAIYKDKVNDGNDGDETMYKTEADNGNTSAYRNSAHALSRSRFSPDAGEDTSQFSSMSSCYSLADNLNKLGRHGDGPMDFGHLKSAMKQSSQGDGQGPRRRSIFNTVLRRVSIHRRDSTPAGRIATFLFGPDDRGKGKDKGSISGE
ncbi:hypothetical protein EGW08_023039 [Elysia chlorotica]|uniref:Uncharacterized protein n=1 Tax=Elysia chlorotica TaxID=188477 RepID=A0A3S1AWL8_ELYCH|nr:hypothetical protein EGW08_023039 [Elysia chlorotica]